MNLGRKAWATPAASWRSIRAPHRAAPSCSARTWRVLGLAQREFAQHFPADGWVEHDPEDIWRTTVETARQALAAAGLGAGDVAAIGITNQRETCVLWDRRTGRPIHNAIVWQDRRTADACRKLKAAGHEPTVTAKTGLLLDPYFSATKIAWLLDHVDGARALAQAGHLAFGTIDSFLLWRLTGGRVHATDATNASRTLLYDIRKGAFDDDLLELFGVPRAILPEVRDCDASYGETEPSILGAAVPILGVAGDQQAATIGQACFAPGMVKATYGTGCFALLNTGAEPVASKNRLLSTVAYQLGGKRTYALEGAIFIAGAAVQWLRDGLRIIESAKESNRLAAAADPGQDVYLVPAFVGLGAPYWRPEARGALFGLTRGSGPNELARAALEAVCYQTRDLLEAMRGDWSARRQVGAARRRRHGGERLDHAVPGRHARCAGRAADHPGDDGAGRCLARRPSRRRVARRRGLRQTVEAGARVQAGARRGGARAQVRRLAARGTCRAAARGRMSTAESSGRG